MAYEVIMPKAGMAMEEGTIIKWFKKEGDKVEIGEPLLEIHTDKVSMEVESGAAGILLKILRQEGEIIPVTQTIGYIGGAGEKISEKQSEAAVPELLEKRNTAVRSEDGHAEVKEESRKIAATPLAKTLARKNGIDLAVVKGSGIGGVIKGKDVEGRRIPKYTPLAGRMAKELNLDLSGVWGSGYNGKIRKEDLPGMDNVDNISTGKGSGSGMRKPMKGMRRIIAERMLKSHLEAPPVTLDAKADVTELLGLRKQVNKALESSISVNDLVMKAVAQSLREYSYINVIIDGGDIVYLDEINLGMAVALPDGLIVPVIRNADKLRLGELSETAKALGSKAKEGRLVPDETTGGTFTVSNLGMLGITSFTPIINPPESAILGVCSVEEVLRLVNGRVESRNIMGLSLTIDHRVIDGAQGAIFLGRIKELLENPMEIILDK